MASTPSPLILSDRDRRLEIPGFVLTETYRPAGLVLLADFHERANTALTIEGSFLETVGAELYEESDHGAGHPLGFTIKANPAVRAMLDPVSRVLQSSGAGLIGFTEDIETDISPLADAGVPCLGLWQDGRTYFNYHHTAADTLDKVVPKELAENVAVKAVLAYALANLRQPLPR